MNPEDLPFDPTRGPSKKFVATRHVPDLTEAVEGWRVWQVSLMKPRFGLPLTMKSAGGGGDYTWTPRRISIAHCDRCGENVPGETCTCGFYSAKTLEHLLSLPYPQYNIDSGFVMVLGQVANWGKVREATEGWRAAKCYPKRIWVPYETPHLAPLLKESYGVPVGLRDWLNDEE